MKAKVARVPKMTERETALIEALGRIGFTVLDADVPEGRNLPADEFDVRVSGVYRLAGFRDEFKFSAWLPLLAVRELTVWPSEAIASMTDYPEMVLAGDWSGVRDSSTEKIMAIFERHVVGPVLEPGSFAHRKGSARS